MSIQITSVVTSQGWYWDLKVNPQITSLIEDLIQSSNDDSLKEVDLSIDVLKEIQQTNKISTTQLRSIYKLNKDKINLKSILKDSKLQFPIKEEPKTPSPELIERRLYLQRQQETREYNQMIFGQDITPDEANKLTLRDEFTTTKNQMSIGMNMIATIFATFGMTYYICIQWKFTDSQSMTFGMVAAIVMMILEMLLFIVRATRIDIYTDKSLKKEQ